MDIVLNHPYSHQLEGIRKLLGGTKFRRKPLSNPLDLVDAINKGITKESFYIFQKKIDIPLYRICQLLPVDPRTLQRYSLKQRLSPNLSSLIVELVELFYQGEETFGDMEQFKAWLQVPNPTLGEKPPFELLNHSQGIQLVSDALGRIAHGLVA